MVSFNFQNILGGLLKREDGDDSSSIQLMDQASLLREILARAYGVPVVRDGHMIYDAAYKHHANLLKASIVVETNQHFFVIHVSRTFPPTVNLVLLLLYSVVFTLLVVALIMCGLISQLLRGPWMSGY